MADGVPARQVKGTVAKTVLSYVRRSLGDDAVERVFELAGKHLAARGLAEPASWTTAPDTIAIAEAAATVCGDTDIGRRAGEELMRLMRERGTVDFVRAAGSIGAALEVTLNAATKMSSGRVFELTEVGDGHAVIRGEYTDSASAHAFFCAHTAGFCATVPEVFGNFGVVTETECQGRGDYRCVYRVSWSANGERGAVEGTSVEASRVRMEGFVTRFEQLHKMATELAGAEGVETLLARITEQAGVAVAAQRYVLAVRTGTDGPLSIHHNGFDSNVAAEKFATRVLASELDADERVMVADVASAARHYGRLAAAYPRGSSVTEMERRLLAAYARHAAAALDSVDALEHTRRDRDSAEALLGLAHALAEVGTQHDVARRLAAAVPAVAGCDRAGVWLWDEDSQCLRLAAEAPDDRDDAHQRPVLRAADVAELGEIVKNPTPCVFNVDEALSPVRELMQADGLERCIAAPIRARGEFLGFVAAGFVGVDSAVDTGDLLIRVRGLADQAATALDNARLLDAMRHQALHDALTGLANRTLAEDRASQTLREGRRHGRPTSLLFVDLDGFKSVNDNLGHEMGDELIRQAGQRIAGCVRASDTVARFGGDEFVVLLPATDSAAAEVVAAKIVDGVGAPFPLASRAVTVSCSIGIAGAPDDGDDYGELLRHADAAMYVAKAAGGAGFRGGSRP